ncbi:hypothetical protein GA0070213_12546 [Micromonospora humi]|uniref:Uncharacterized protein n=1 Tax=Micromonospora humi TaxID=745366 RepID=A0A1C5K968_9ACTN|nr:hypothetical protein GA0070213_12546 [Micromonospora humi]
MSAVLADFPVHTPATHGNPLTEHAPPCRGERTPHRPRWGDAAGSGAGGAR